MIWADWIWLLAGYGFAGWTVSSIVCSLRTGKWVNRGLLGGPFCIGAGLGACLLVLLSSQISVHWTIVMAAAMILTLLLHHFGDFILEKLFRARWNGFEFWPLAETKWTALVSAVLGGLSGIMLIRIIQPWVETLLDNVPNMWRVGVGLVLAAGLLIDLWVSLVQLGRLNRQLAKLEQKINHLTQLKSPAARRNRAVKTLIRAEIRAVSAMAATIRRDHRRVLDAYPAWRSVNWPKASEAVHKGLLSKRKLIWPTADVVVIRSQASINRTRTRPHQ